MITNTFDKVRDDLLIIRSIHYDFLKGVIFEATRRDGTTPNVGSRKFAYCTIQGWLGLNKFLLIFRDHFNRGVDLLHCRRCLTQMLVI